MKIGKGFYLASASKDRRLTKFKSIGEADKKIGLNRRPIFIIKIDLLNTRPVIPLNIGGFWIIYSPIGFLLVMTFTELGDRVSIRESSQKSHLYKTWRGSQSSVGRKGLRLLSSCKHRLSDLVFVM